MQRSQKHHYPNLCKEFKSRDEIAKLIFRSKQTVARSLSGNRPFEEYEIRRMEEYTGKSREYLLLRRE